MIPRCMVLFENSCKTKATFKTYKFLFEDIFLKWCDKDPESFRLLPVKEMEELLQDYCIHLKKKVEENTMNPNSIPTYFNAIWKFLKINRIKVDKEAIMELYPEKTKRGGDKAVTTEQLRILLNVADTLRDKALVHVFSATGARPEALCELQFKHISDYEDGFMKLLLYSEDYKHEMFTFLHQEAVKSLKDYFEERKANGEKITSESWIFESLERKLLYNTLENMMLRLWKRSRIERIKKGNRYDLASTTSIRKRFDTVLEMNPNVSTGALQYLMDHTGYLSGEYYRRPTEEQVFKAYRAVSADLMISSEIRLEIEVKKREDYLQRQNQDYARRLEKTEKLLQIVLKKLEKEDTI